MYPKNAASPPRISVGPVVQISDGAVQASGVSIKVLPEGGSSSDGGGTTGYEQGIVHYVPTQAETNYTAFIVIAYKTGCIPASTTVVTTASATAGKVDVGAFGGTAVTGRDIGASVLLSAGTGTGQIALSSGAVTVGTNNDKTGYTASTVSDKTGYSLTGAQSISSLSISGAVSIGTTLTVTGATTLTGQVTATNASNDFRGCGISTIASQSVSASGGITFPSGTLASTTGAVGSVTGAVGSVTGAVGSVTGAVGSVTSGVTLAASQHVIVDSGTVTTLTNVPANFTSLAIDASGRVQIQSGTETGKLDCVSGAVKLAANQDVRTVTGNVTGSVGSISGVTFPTRFSSLAIDTSGYVSADLVQIQGFGTTATVLSDLLTATALNSGVIPADAAGIRTAVGLATANLDTQLGDVPTVAEFNARTLVAASYATASALDAVDNYVDTEVAAIKAVTDKLDTILEVIP